MHVKRGHVSTQKWWPPINQEKKPQNETYQASTLMLDSAASRTVRYKCLLLKLPTLLNFVMAALAEADRDHIPNCEDQEMGQDLKPSEESE